MCAKRLLVKFLFILFFIASISNVFAQSNKISGKVLDIDNNNPVVGASIVIEQNKKGTNSDAEGGFFLVIPQNQKVNIIISSVGYLPKTLRNISAAAAGQTFEIGLKRANTQLGTVVVRSAGARRETISSLYLQQKNSSSISDGISAEVIKRSPDRSTGEVLKRVSGASVQDNKFVVIRGLSERYNTSMLNNSMLPSTEPDKKAFSFDIIPSSLIDNLLIYKSATPDLPGDFAGGAIKVSTKDFPSKQLSEFSFSASYNSLTTFKNFYKSRDEGQLDFLGFFDNKSRLIPAPYYKRRGSAFFGMPNQFKREVTKLFPNTFGYQNAYRSAPNLSFSYTGGNTKLIGNNKLGFIYAVNYGTGRRIANRTRDEYVLTDKQFQYEYNTTNYDVRNNLSGLLNLSYSYGRSKISWKNLFNNEFTNTVALRDGRNDANTPEVFYYKSTNTEAMNNGLFNSVVEGLHSLKKDWTIDWAGSFGLTYRNQPDQKILTFVTDADNPSAYYFKPGFENSPEIRNAGRIYSYLTEGVYGANINVTKQFTWLGETQKLKFGTYNYLRDRNVEVTALGYGTLNGTAPAIEITKGLSFSNIINPETIDQYNLTLTNIPSQSIDYNGKVVSNAGYVMLDNKFSDKLKLTWGARIEKYKQTINTVNRHQTYDNTDILPSVLFTFSLNNKTNLRLASSQSVNRPEFRELADYRVYDYENYIIVAGNPGLVRSKITNADLKYEFFPSGGEILSISAFYKNFNNPIEQINAGNDVYSYQNAKTATTYGAELELRKKLNFINGSLFNNLTAYANAAYIKGNVRFNDDVATSKVLLQGQSPYLINAGLTYSGTGDHFSVTALYNKIGPRLRFRAPQGGALNIYEKPRDLLDLQITKKLSHNRLEARLTISDILAQSFKWYYKFESNPSNINYKEGEDRIVNSYRYGTTTTISIRYNLK